MKKHFASVMACILICTMLLASCGEPTPTTQPGTNAPTTAATQTAPVSTGEPEEVPDIPAPEDLGFDGQELTILVWKAAGRNTV